MATKKRKPPPKPPEPHEPPSLGESVERSVQSEVRPVLVDSTLLWKMAAVALIGAFIWSVRGVLVPLLFVAVFTFLGAPVVARLERRNVRRSVGSALYVTGLVLVVALLLAMVLPALINDLTELFTKLPQAIGQAATWIEKRFHVQIPSSWSEISGAANQEILESFAPVAKSGAGAAAATVKTGVGVLKGAAAIVGGLFLIPVLTFFVLTELPETLGFVKALAPRRMRREGEHYAPLINDALSRLIRGQLLVALMMSGIYIVGLWIARVPLAMAIGIIAGAAYLIPFASGTVCFILAALFSLMEKGADALWPVVGALVVCVVVQIVETYILTPKIVGEQAGLSPLAALLAVLLGGSAGGFLGVLFALPIGCVLALVIREEARRRGASLGGAA